MGAHWPVGALPAAATWAKAAPCTRLARPKPRAAAQASPQRTLLIGAAGRGRTERPVAAGSNAALLRVALVGEQGINNAIGRIAEGRGHEDPLANPAQPAGPEPVGMEGNAA